MVISGRAASYPPPSTRHVTTYVLENGSTVTVPDNWDQPQPLVSAGPALAGPWIEFTPLEQQMVAAGSAAAVTALICAASGGVACPVASAATAAVGVWIGNNGGICPNNQRMLVEMTWTGQVRGVSCR